MDISFIDRRARALTLQFFNTPLSRACFNVAHLTRRFSNQLTG